MKMTDETRDSGSIRSFRLSTKFLAGFLSLLLAVTMVSPESIRAFAQEGLAPEEVLVDAESYETLADQGDFVVEEGSVVGFSESGRAKFESLGVGSRALSIPAIPGVDSIEGDFTAFGIESLEIAEGYVSVGNDVFRDNKITSLVAPLSLKTIGEAAFANNALTEVSLPGATSLGARAFYANDLHNADLPLIQSIGGEMVDNAFGSNNRVVAINTTSTELSSFFTAGDGFVVNPVTMVVKRQNAEGVSVGSDVIVGADFQSANLYPAGEICEVVAPALTGYRVVGDGGDRQSVMATQGLEISFVYESAKAKVNIVAADKFFKVGDTIDEAALLEGIRAYSSLDGSDAVSLSVSPNTIDSSAESATLVTYKAIDVYGNVGTRTVSVKVSLAPDQIYIDNFWQYLDFTYEGETLTGFSEHGIEKFNSGDAGKYLALPGVNPYENVAVTTVGTGFKLYAPQLKAIDFSKNASLKTIKEEAFYQAKQITSLDFSSCVSLESIEFGAFYNTAQLTSIDFSNCSSLKNLDEGAFGKAAKLTALDFSDCTSLTTIGDKAFFLTNALTTIDFSGCFALETIGMNAFATKPNLINLDFTGCSSLRTIENGAFSGASILTAVDFSDCVALESIGDNAFKNASALEELDLSNHASLTNIGSEAFCNTQALERVDLSGCTALETIGYSAFYYAENLTTLDLSDCSSLKTIDEAAFFSTEKLTTLDLSGCSSLTFIGENAFLYAESLPALDFSDCVALETIGKKAFNSADGLTKIDFSNCVSLKTIGEDAFGLSGNVETLDFSDCISLETIGDSAFRSYSPLFKVDFSNCVSLKTIGEWAFRYSGGISELDFSDCVSLETIKGSAFEYSQNLLKVDFSGCTSLRAIEESAFALAQKMVTLDFSGCSSLQIIGPSAFAEARKLTDLNFSGCSSLKMIGSNAFVATQSLRTLDLSECTSLEIIGYNAFASAKSLSEIDFSGCSSLRMIGDYAFEESTGLTELDFSACTSLAQIGEYAFASARLTTLDLSALTQFEGIGNRAFEDSTFDTLYIGGISEANDTDNLYRSYWGTEGYCISDNNHHIYVFILGDRREVKTAPGYLLDPVEITVKCVDATTGDPVANDRLVLASAPLTDYLVSAPALFDYRPVEQTKTVSVPAPSDLSVTKCELVFEYESDPVGDLGYTLVHEYAEYSPVSPGEYGHIGESRYITRFDVSASFGNVLDDVDVYLSYDPSRIKFEGTAENIDKNAVQVDASLPGLVKFSFSQGQTYFQMPLVWTLIPGPTELHREFPIESSLILNRDGGSKAVAQANPVILKGTYIQAGILKEGLVGESNYRDSSGVQYQDIVGDTASATYILSAGTPAYIGNARTVSTFERNVGDLTFTDQLPMYLAVESDGSEAWRIARLSQSSIDAGWKYNDDESFATFTIQESGIGPRETSLTLEFPDIKPETKVTNTASFITDIEDPWLEGGEPTTFSGSSSWSTVFLQESTKGTFNKFGWEEFFDTKQGRSKEFTWRLVFVPDTSESSATRLENVVIEDHDLDERMRYTRVISDGKEPMSIEAFNDAGELLFDASSVSTEVTFPEEIRDEISRVTISPENVVESGKRLRYTVVTEIKDPDAPIDPDKTSFFNSGTVRYLEAGKEKVLGPKDQEKKAVPYNPGIGLSKSVLASTNGLGPHVYTSGDAVDYEFYLQKYRNSGSSFVLDGGIYAVLKNVTLRDLVPQELTGATFVPSSALVRASEGLEYEVVGEGYIKDGKTYDLLEIRIASLDLAEFSNNESLGRMETTVDPLSVSGVSFDNTAYLTFDNTENLALVGKTTNDHPFDGVTDEVLYASSHESTLLIAYGSDTMKYARKALADDGATWGPWTPSGVKVLKGESYQYRLTMSNVLGSVNDGEKEGIVFYDILPYQGDTWTKDGSSSRGSAHANTLEGIEAPAGYEVWVTTDRVFDLADLEAAQWLPTADYSQVTALKVKAMPGTTLGYKERVDVVVTMKANQVVDEGRAYNSFTAQSANTTPVESNRVYAENYLPAKIILTKKGELEDGGSKALEGATFHLCDLSGNIIAAGVTGQDGTLTFEGFEAGSYVIKEAKAPEGYALSTEPLLVDALDFSPVDGYLVAEVSADNELAPEYGSIEITKVDAAGDPLAGVTFTVTSLDDQSISYTKTTSNDGKLLFSGLLTGDYVVAEISAPGVLKPLVPFVVTVSKSGTIPKGVVDGVSVESSGLKIVNNKVNIDVYKLGMRFDEKRNLDATELTINDGDPLVGVTLKLYREKDNQLLGDYATGEGGHFSLTGLDAGEKYYLHEEAAPAGYDLAEDSYFMVSPEGLLTDGEGVAFDSGAVIVKDLSKQLTRIYKLGIVLDENKALDATELMPHAGYRLENAVFEVWQRPEGDPSTSLDESTWIKLGGTVTSNTKGIIEGFFPTDTLFCLKEITAPDGYMLPQEGDDNYLTYFENRVDLSGRVTLVDEGGVAYVSRSVIVKDYPTPISADLIIEKKDAVSGGPLSEAIFKLEKKTGEVVEDGIVVEEHFEVISDTLRSDAGGMITYDDLAQGTYRLSEVSAPEGYLTTARVEVFTVSDSTDITFVGENAFTNVKIAPYIAKGDYVGTYDPLNDSDVENMAAITEYLQQSGFVAHPMRVSDNQIVLLAGLGGATFTVDVYDAYAPDAVPLETLTVTSDADGKFSSLNDRVFLEDYTYVFTEISAPQGYLTNSTPYVFQPANERESIEALGGKWISLENKVRDHRIVVSKYDALSQTSLAGAGFTLYYADGVPVYVDDAGDALERISDAKGYVEFSHLTAGIYYLQETTSPGEDFTLPQGYWRIVIDGSKDIEASTTQERVDRLAGETILGEYEDAGTIALRLYNNRKDAIELEVAKVVENGNEADASFGFLIEVDTGSGYAPYVGPLTISGSAGVRDEYTAKGKFTLKDGQKVSIKTLRKNTPFRITELDSELGNYQVRNMIDGSLYADSAIAEGVLSPSGTSVVFTNRTLYDPIATKRVDKETAGAGDHLTYSIEVENTTGLDGADVWVRDYLPEGVSYFSHDASAHSGRYVADTKPYLDWYIEDMAIGERVTLSFVVKVDEGSAGKTIVNAALFERVRNESDPHDPFAENDPTKSTNEAKTVIGIPDGPENPDGPDNPDGPENPSYPENPSNPGSPESPVIPLYPPARPTLPPAPPRPTPAPNPGPSTSVSSQVTELAESLSEGEAVRDASKAIFSMCGIPLTEHTGVYCWVHWFILLGILITALYSVPTIMRRRRHLLIIREYENEAMERISPHESAVLQ